jgi:hypothetical protein
MHVTKQCLIDVRKKSKMLSAWEVVQRTGYCDNLTNALSQGSDHAVPRV